MGKLTTPLAIAMTTLFWLAAPATAAPVTLRLDFGDDGLMAGWHDQVNGTRRFDNGSAASATIDADGDGNDETIRAGYHGYAQSSQNSSPRSLPSGFDTTWPTGYTTELQEDFSNPNSGLTIWNLPEGNYEVTIYMRDWQYGASVYRIKTHDDTIFEVFSADKVDGDLSSISDTHTISTILYDPDGAGTAFDARPSIRLIPNGSDRSAIMGVELTYIPAPEPATMALLGLGGLAMAGASLRRRR